MTTPTDTKPDRQARRTAEQNAQARLVLIQLLWLAVLLLIGSIIWLANNQKKLAVHLDERLKITETFNARMNAMDDRIFAISTTGAKTTKQGNPQNDLQLVTIELAQAHRLYQSGYYKESSEILQILQWQLTHDALTLATPLKSALKATLQDDITHLTAMQTQTDAWQQNILTMRAVQTYLRTQSTDHNHIDQKALAIHDATLLLSLAIGATSLREQDTQAVYLQEVIANLEKIRQSESKHEATNDPTTPNDSIDSLEKAIHALNGLLNNPPSLTPLKSRELLKNY